MKICDLREAALEWTVTIEGPDEFGDAQRAQVQIEKRFEGLAAGEIGLSIDADKRITSALQAFVVKQELVGYGVCVTFRARGSWEGQPAGAQQLYACAPIHHTSHA